MKIIVIVLAIIFILIFILNIILTLSLIRKLSALTAIKEDLSYLIGCSGVNGALTDLIKQLNTLYYKFIGYSNKLEYLTNNIKIIKALVEANGGSDIPEGIKELLENELTK